MEKILNAVDKNRQLILDAERYIWKNPETGYKEYKTSAYMAEKFEALGYELHMAEGITGFYTVLDTGRPGPTVLVLGELDSIICPGHKEADPQTGAVHSCGHNAQCAALLGIAAALKEPGAIDAMCGKIKLCAVPAEEFLEVEFRRGLRAEGKIKYFGGKPEFLYRGYFDDVDLAFMIHTSSINGVRAGSNGCLVKNIIYKGKASHAGGSPQNGINALYAANCGLNAINAIRETFVDFDHIRVHPIMTFGGAMVNAIPEKAILESYVRGKTNEAIIAANKKVNRAIVGAAISLGANVEIIDVPGYSPLVNDCGMKQMAKDAFERAFPGVPFNMGENYSTGSTDMGDLSTVMPVVHPYVKGNCGTSHGADYGIADPEWACVNSAKWQMTMLLTLLENDAARAKEIIANHTPYFKSHQEYFDFMDSLNCEGDRVTYNEDGTALADIH